MTEPTAKPKRVRKRVKPFGSNAAKRIDGRTREAKLMHAMRADLIAHVGNPNTAELILIETCVRLQMHLAWMDKKFMDSGDMNPFDSRRYTAWANTLARTLARLGLKGAAAKGPNLAEYLASKVANTTPASAP